MKQELCMRNTLVIIFNLGIEIKEIKGYRDILDIMLSLEKPYSRSSKEEKS